MATTSSSSSVVLLPPDAQPPKSKSAAYYAVHPHWQDVIPIPQVDQTGVLAPIAYSPRYSEAMSFLRALMAENEVSERALALTEDLISMNPAHYTVWIYRMRILKGLWQGSTSSDNIDTKIVEINEDKSSQQSDTDDNEIKPGLWRNIQDELKWLDEVSFRNLKNYQIWHHRHALVELLPLDPAGPATPDSPKNSPKNRPTQPSSKATNEILSSFIASEQLFLSRILSQDTKNYHVWSYRQWLCARFPSLLLPSYSSNASNSIASTYRTHAEVQAIDTMIQDDLRNNSAWSHRYFILFGHHELTYVQSQSPPIILKEVNEQKLLHKADLVDADLVTAEIEYTKHEIRKAPQNGSTWNYLRGLLRHGDVRITTLRAFCEEFLGPEGDLWTDQWVDVELEDPATKETRVERQEIGVRSSHAVEWLSEIYSKDETAKDEARAKECLRALAEKWDPIRKGYWDYKLSKLEEK
ncbi:CAAX geranylgeranyltransferase alpha subunit [Lithohypha guttulata]|nr:CAAX geranylgeranyltransferase alpha subunit [Lithohypha guttulata]